MKRAAIEKLRTLHLWRTHLRKHRAEGTAVACVCELQPGRFRKSQRIGGCGNPRCWVCHSGKLGGEPTLKQLRSRRTFNEGLAEVLLSNNRLERSNWRVSASPRPPAAQAGR